MDIPKYLKMKFLKIVILIFTIAFTSKGIAQEKIKSKYDISKVIEANMGKTVALSKLFETLGITVIGQSNNQSLMNRKANELHKKYFEDLKKVVVGKSINENYAELGVKFFYNGRQIEGLDRFYSIDYAIEKQDALLRYIAKKVKQPSLIKNLNPE